MATIRKEITVRVSAQHAWDAVRDVGNVHRRLCPTMLVDATLEVRDDGPARCTLVWTTDLLPDEVAPAVAALVQGGAEDMQRALERAAG